MIIRSWSLINKSWKNLVVAIGLGTNLVTGDDQATYSLLLGVLAEVIPGRFPFDRFLPDPGMPPFLIISFSILPLPTWSLKFSSPPTLSPLPSPTVTRETPSNNGQRQINAETHSHTLGGVLKSWGRGGERSIGDRGVNDTTGRHTIN